MKRNPEDIKYRYFSPVEGHLVPRYGAPNQYIGARLVPSGKATARSLLGPSGQGTFIIVWDTKHVERIALEEVTKYGREYARAVSDGSLKERKAKDYDTHIKAVEAAEKKAAKEGTAEKEAATEPNEADKPDGKEK
ncbi:MAG: hypothetical protein U9Q07_04215 [Planctomycetota bacterium]|nr:hypothetical protein [Planctomycetota bacterium]